MYTFYLRKKIWTIKWNIISERYFILYELNVLLFFEVKSVVSPDLFNIYRDTVLREWESDNGFIIFAQILSKYQSYGCRHGIGKKEYLPKEGKECTKKRRNINFQKT